MAFSEVDGQRLVACSTVEVASEDRPACKVWGKIQATDEKSGEYILHKPGGQEISHLSRDTQN